MMKRYSIPQIKMVYVSDVTRTPERITGSADTAAMFRESFEPGEIEMQEYFKVMYLDRANHIIGIHTVAMGGIDLTAVDARIIFGGALTAKATSMILCHNHPSGASKPSIQDDALTNKLSNGAKLLDLRILDHIIITTDNYFSYADERRIIV